MCISSSLFRPTGKDSAVGTVFHALRAPASRLDAAKGTTVFFRLLAIPPLWVRIRAIYIKTEAAHTMNPV